MPPTRKEKGHYGRRYVKMRLEVIYSEPQCYLCGEWIDKDLHWMDPGAPQLHLVVPRTLGGSWRDRNNCRASHRRCNIRQSNNWDGTVNHSMGPREADELLWLMNLEP